MQRRDFMGAVAGVAATRWESEDYDPENVDEWKPIRGGRYTTGRLRAEQISAEGNGPATDWKVTDDQLDERQLIVSYDSEGPWLAVVGSADDRSFYHEVGADLDPEEAKQLAGALFQAAWEYENRDVEAIGQ